MLFQARPSDTIAPPSVSRRGTRLGGHEISSRIVVICVSSHCRLGVDNRHQELDSVDGRHHDPTTRPVVYGLLAGVGLAAALATILIATPAAAPIAESVRVTDPIAYAGSVLLIVAACLLAAWIPATRAARLDPMQTLRQE
jgi:hypothetical protein